MKFKSLLTSFRLIALLIVLLGGHVGRAQYIITTVAGSTNYGDGGAATAAELNQPNGVALDGFGNVYIADQSNNRVRKVSISGVITTVAGTGIAGFSGDGGPATAAKLNYPGSVIIDGSGNLFVADEVNFRIRKVSSSGIISTIAGSGIAGFSGDGGAATSALIGSPCGMALDRLGNLYFADPAYNRIRKIAPSGIITSIAGNGLASFGGDGGAATAASLNFPKGIAVDTSGIKYITDFGNHRIRKISVSGVISTIAGSDSAGCSGDGGSATASVLSQPFSIATDISGNIYFSEQYCWKIRKITVAGIIITIAGSSSVGYLGDGGPATLAGLVPNGIAVDSSGNIIIADLNNRIRKVNTSGIINTIAGNGYASYGGDSGLATSAFLYQPPDVVMDTSGNLYVADQFNNRIRKITHDGVITTFAGEGTQGYSGDWGAATNAQLTWPIGLAIDRDGNVFFADMENSCIRKVDTGGVITTVAGTGGFYYSGGYGFAGDGGAATAALLCFPTGVAVDESGNIFIADVGNNRIRKVTSDGIISTIAGSDSAGYSGDGGAATLARLNGPAGVALDAGGNVYVADQWNGVIRCIAPSGIITTFAGDGYNSYWGDEGSATDAELNVPGGVAVDGSGNVYIADLNNNRIRMVTTDGVIHTIAGNGHPDFGGDGGMSTAAELNYPNGVFVDAVGRVFIADQGNNRVRKLDPCAYFHVENISGATHLCAGDTIHLSEVTQYGIWSSSNNALATVSSTGIVTAVSAGIDTIKYTVTNGCGVFITRVPVTVNPLPNAGAITGPLNVCIGAAVSLGDVATGGVWSSSSASIATINSFGAVSGLSVGVDTIHYSVTNSCGTSIASRIINVNALPNPGVISGPTTVCVGGNITLSDATGSGTWTSGSTGIATISSSGIVTGVFSGTVTMSYTVSNTFCSASATYTVTVNPLPNAGAITGSSTVCPGALTTLFDAAGGGTWASSTATIATINSFGVVTGVASGVDTIRYSVTNSCGTATATHVMLVNQPPHAAAISGPSSVCAGGGTITLSDSVSGGSWSGGSSSIATVNSSGVVTGVAAGTINISYSVTTVCGTAVATRAITVTPLPTGGTITGAASICEGASTTFSDAVSGGVWSSGSFTVATINSSGVITGLAPGTSTIFYTVTTACGTATATHTIVINPLPHAGVISGAANVCAGAATTLSDSISGGSWRSGSSAIATVSSSGIVTGIAEGSTTLYYVFTNGCGSDTAIFTFTVNPLPDAGVITGVDTVCPGNFITLADTTTGGSWSSTDNSLATVSATGIVTGVSGGAVTLRYIASNSCGADTAFFPFTVKSASECTNEVGVIGVSTGYDLVVFPNPNDGLFTVNLFASKHEDVMVSITNVLGQKVTGFTMNTNEETSVQLAVPGGVYFLTATTKERSITRKVVIE